jgi:hypothetical protein
MVVTIVAIDRITIDFEQTMELLFDLKINLANLFDSFDNQLVTYLVQIDFKVLIARLLDMRAGNQAYDLVKMHGFNGSIGTNPCHMLG